MPVLLRPAVEFICHQLLWSVANIKKQCDKCRMVDPVGAFIALALWSASTNGHFDQMERITAEEAVKRAKKCGLGGVTIRYGPEWQLEILTVTDAAEASDSQLDCLDKATGWSIFVELPADIQHRFDAIREARVSAIMLVEDRKWLGERGMLGRVPEYMPGVTDAGAFTREVEKLCGPRADGAFQSEYGFHALSPSWLDKVGMPLKPENEEVFMCLLKVTRVAGFEVGFIGNAVYPAPN